MTSPPDASRPAGPSVPAVTPGRRIPWRRSVVALAILVGLFSWLGLTWQARRTALGAIRAGKQALLDDELEAALSHFETGLAARPIDPELLFYLGRAQRKLGQIPAARISLDAALAAGQDAETIEIERSLLAAAEGRYQDEENYLLAAVQKRHPSAAAILEVAAKWYFLRFNLQRTNFCLKLWKELEPDSVTMWQLTGELYVRYHNGPLAIESFREAYQRNPRHWGVRVALSTAMLERKQFTPELQAMLEQMHAERPEDAVVLARLGQFALDQARTEDARRYFEQSLARKPDDAITLTALAQIDLDAGDAAAALPRLEAAMRTLEGEQEQVLYSYFRCLSRLGRTEEAQRIETRWKACNQDLKTLYETARLISGNPDDPELRRIAGEICLRNRRETDGLRWLASALELDAAHEATHRTFAEYYERAGQKELAQRHREWFKAAAAPVAPEVTPTPAPK